MNKSKIKGTAWETQVVRYLQDHGALHIERRALCGDLDRGDIAGIPGVVIEAKNVAKLELAAWLDEAETERDNDHADLGVVWHKRKGRISPGKGYVTMSGDALVTLLRAAGYLASEDPQAPRSRQIVAAESDEGMCP